MKTLIAMLLTVFLTSCAVQPHVLKDPAALADSGSDSSGQATVYVMRDSSGMGMAWSIDVKVDGDSQGSIRRETYVQFNVASGKHVLLAKWPSLSGLPDIAAEADFEADKTYYFIVSTSFGLAYNTATYGIKFSQVPPNVAKTHIQSYERRL